jgi:hypothetical protein
MVGRIFGIAVLSLILAGFLVMPLVAVGGKRENFVACVVASAGFAGIAAGTWFFSSRPKLFIRCLLPRYAWRDWRQSIRHMLHDPGFGKAMRLMAVLQFAAAALFFGGTLLAWFVFR